MVFLNLLTRTLIIDILGDLLYDIYTVYTKLLTAHTSVVRPIST